MPHGIAIASKWDTCVLSLQSLQDMLFLPKTSHANSVLQYLISAKNWSCHLDNGHHCKQKSTLCSTHPVEVVGHRPARPPPHGRGRPWDGGGRRGPPPPQAHAQGHPRHGGGGGGEGHFGAVHAFCCVEGLAAPRLPKPISTEVSF